MGISSISVLKSDRIKSLTCFTTLYQNKDRYLWPFFVMGLANKDMVYCDFPSLVPKIFANLPKTSESNMRRLLNTDLYTEYNEMVQQIESID